MDVEVEKPHIHHHRVGHRLLDLALPIAALFVSFVSILIAWHHGQVMKELVHQNERLVQANSLPWLQLYGSFRVQGPLNAASMEVTNAGVGPGEIRSVQILVDGKPVPDLRTLMRVCCGVTDSAPVGSSTLLGNMLRPGQSISYISTPLSPSTKDLGSVFNKARQAERIETRLCYCSVFGDCWNITSRANTRPKPTAQCERPQPQYIQ